jgi:hypothetical protein
MTDVQVIVSPAQGGWILHSAPYPPLVFLSGGRAEAGAHRLGQSLASAGSDALVLVHDRRGQVIGETRYFRDRAAGGRPR